MIREAAVLGQFYPNSYSELSRMIKEWDHEATLLGSRIAIVPHAGYVFSGECAWKALTQIEWSALHRVVIIGPSHRVNFSGVSVSLATEYQTVEATHPMDREYAKHMLKKFDLVTEVEAHREHSTEVQVPLIHELAPTLPIVELVYSSNAVPVLYKYLLHLLTDTETGVIISSDLSHYYSEALAHKMDSKVREGIENGDLKALLQGEACGMPGIQALLSACLDSGKSLRLVDYRTSGDSKYGDKERVVGYLSALMQ